MNNIFELKVEKNTGEITTLEEHKGKVILIVNTASKCGYTPQLTGLQKLYEDYKESGFVVLGFPCNQFLRQDPDTIEEITQFCKVNYGVSFPIYAKTHVKGRKQSDLYKFLVKNSRKRKGRKVKWNFEKFLINKDGKVVNRFLPKIKPEKLTKDIEALLK
jgi:glutathione peroxidase